jgi:hypothetical protein
MRAGIAWFSLAVLASGCTAAVLDRNTVNQAMSVTNMRYQEVMDNLAVVAHNTGTLPSFALNGGGIPQVINVVNVEPKSTWDAVGFLSQSLNVFGKHNPQATWSFEPIVSQFQLAALHYVCLWAVCGPEYVDSDGQEYLRAPRRTDVFPSDPCAKPPSNRIPHFDVMHRLEQLPPHWLKCGCRRDVHSCACYKAKCGDTYVWVDPGDLKALSDFTLVVLDIASRDPGSLAAAIPTAQVVVCGNFRPDSDPCSACGLGTLCNCMADCKCSFDPIPPAPDTTSSITNGKPADCSMNVGNCDSRTPKAGEQPNASLAVTETWQVYQADSEICKNATIDCEPPQISCGHYVVYSGNYMVNLPYVCKARPAGSPCPPKVPAPIDPIGPYANEALRQETYNKRYKEANPPQSFVIPQFEPPAAYGSHASPPNR